MFNHPFALELAYIAVEEAVRLGASYADARYEFSQHEDVTTQNRTLTQASTKTERGLGIRALVGGAWGFSSVSEPTRHDVSIAAKRAVELARAASVLQEYPIQLVEQPPQRSLYRTQIKRDPLAVPLEDKIDLLLAVEETMRKVPQIVMTNASFSAHRQRKIFVNSEGSEIDQELVWTGAGYQAGASDGQDLQIRSYPAGARGRFMGKGWELINELALVDNAKRIAEEAVTLLKAEPCPHETTTLILGSAQAAAQVQNSCQQLFELDRVLGLDESGLGGSFLTSDNLANQEIGSKHVNLFADATEVGGAGSYGFDDEGVEAQRIDLVTEGRYSGILSNRETAQRVGLEQSCGAMRASGWSTVPTIRSTNLLMEPGQDGDEEALLADTKSGIYMDISRGFSVDDRGRSVLAACEIAWEIKDGKKVRPLKNPSYRAGVSDLWTACSGVADRSAFGLYGSADHRKGAPLQIVPVGHGASVVRFEKVEVGGHGVVAPRVEEGAPLAFESDGDSDASEPAPPPAAPQKPSKKKRGSKKRKTPRKDRK